MKILSKGLIMIKRILSIRMDGNMGIHYEPRIFILNNIQSTWSRLRIIFYLGDILSGAYIALITIKRCVSCYSYYSKPERDYIYISISTVMNNLSRLIIQIKRNYCILFDYHYFQILPSRYSRFGSKVLKSQGCSKFRHHDPGSHQFGDKLRDLRFEIQNFEFAP